MNQQKKILIIFGTRPEVIKLAPVVRALQREKEFLPLICATGQHRDMADMMMQVFDLQPDYNLDIMQNNQTPFDVTQRTLVKLEPLLRNVQPDMVIVQGDTTTTFSAALAAFYMKISITHVEAGLRTHNRYEPFPEEINRRLTSHIASLHFAPTENTKQNLLAEGIAENTIHVTGNTVIDALLMVRERVANMEFKQFENIDFSKKVILATVHRREIFGEPLKQICLAFKKLIKSFPDIEIVYPVHKNPNVRETVFGLLGQIKRIHLLEPLDYLAFVAIMDKSYLILTDSGGIQEEAPSLNKPVLILRQVTERPEVINKGAAKLVGSDPDKIVQLATELLENPNIYRKMALAPNPFGDGSAAKQICEKISEFFRM